MKYTEVKFEDIEPLYKGSNKYKDLGTYGWIFPEEYRQLIKDITARDGWRVVKVIDADPQKTHGYKCDYYFISDEDKCFVTVAQEHWDSGSFERYLERVIGKLKQFEVKGVRTYKKTGKKTKFAQHPWAHDTEEAKKSVMDDLRKFYPEADWEIAFSSCIIN